MLYFVMVAVEYEYTMLSTIDEYWHLENGEKTSMMYHSQMMKLL